MILTGHPVINRAGGVTVVGFDYSRDLDTLAVTEIDQALLKLASGDNCRLLLDFSNVEYLSSTALGLLVRLNRALTEIGGRMIICEAKPYIREIFEITKLDQLLHVEDDRVRALESLSE